MFLIIGYTIADMSRSIQDRVILPLERSYTVVLPHDSSITIGSDQNELVMFGVVFVEGDITIKYWIHLRTMVDVATGAS
jgi:hypothetical protein